MRPLFGFGFRGSGAQAIMMVLAMQTTEDPVSSTPTAEQQLQQRSASALRSTTSRRRSKQSTTSSTGLCFWEDDQRELYAFERYLRRLKERCKEWTEARDA